MTTIMPISSHAMMHSDEAKGVQTTQAAEKHDCHHGAKADSDKTTDKNGTANKSCCGEDMCKCLNGFCHSGLAKIFGNSGDSLIALFHTAAKVASTDENADSAFLEGLKRPPRA